MREWGKGLFGLVGWGLGVRGSGGSDSEFRVVRQVDGSSILSADRSERICPTPVLFRVDSAPWGAVYLEMAGRILVSVSEPNHYTRDGEEDEYHSQHEQGPGNEGEYH